MISKDATYAVIWASNNENKYGYKVFYDLLKNKYHVIAINPNEKIILWKKVYATLSDVKEKIDVAIFVVPPKVTEIVLHEVFQLKITRVRMQPWSGNDTAINFCKQNNIDYVANACIMIEKNK